MCEKLGEKLGDVVRGKRQRTLAARGKFHHEGGKGTKVFFDWGGIGSFFWGVFFVVLGLGLVIIWAVFGGFCRTGDMLR